MTRPTVVIDALLLRPRPTGVGRAILDWTAALAELDLGLDVVVLATHPDLLPQLAERPGWRIATCHGARGGTFRKACWTQFRMPGMLRELGASLLHCMNFVAPLRCPCPTVTTVHDLGYRHFPDTIEQPRRMYYEQMVPRSLERATTVVCNSDATVKDVHACFPDLQAPVVATPFGTPRWVAGREPSPPGDPAEAPFLFVGTLEPRKNLETLLRGYTTFVEERIGGRRTIPRLRLVGGRGWQDSGIREVLEPLVKAGWVTLLDYCGNDDLWHEYGMARALLFPSLHEGFGFPILEAMAAGLPVLTSDRGAMAEVAGDAALLVDPVDVGALVRSLHVLADDGAYRQELIDRGRVRCRAWHWTRTAEITAEVYRSVLAGEVGKPGS